MIDFSKISKKCFFGFKKDIYKGEEILVADKEKLFIDCIMFQHKIDLNETLQFFRNVELDISRIKEYCRLINSYSLNKRVGYAFKKLKKITLNLDINNKYEKFNINRDCCGKKDKKWKIYDNEVLTDE